MQPAYLCKKIVLLFFKTKSEKNYASHSQDAWKESFSHEIFSLNEGLITFS